MVETSKLTDEELVEKMIRGDETAFSEIYIRKQPPIHRFVLHMTNSQAAAEDISQEVFIALIETAHTFNASRASLSTYLYGIARKQVLRWLQTPDRRRWLHPNSVQQNESAVVTSPGTTENDPFNELVRGNKIDMVRTAIQSLPRKYREALALCDLEELSYSEAARILHCAVGTLRSRLHRARRLLLEKLAKNLRDEKEQKSRENPYELPTL
jgi:RNA polymerase sigma-70 factor, ECF subfamily